MRMKGVIRDALSKQTPLYVFLSATMPRERLRYRHLQREEINLLRAEPSARTIVELADTHLVVGQLKQP